MRWQYLVVLPLLAHGASAGTIHFKAGDFARTLAFSDYLTDDSGHYRSGKSHYLLAFNGPVGQDQLDLLAKAGAMVTAFVPDNSIMVVAPDSFAPTGLNILYATRLRPEQKRADADTFTSVVEFHPDVDPVDASKLLAKSGLTILQHPDLLANHYMVLGSTAGLELWDEVDYIFPASPELLAGQHVYACAALVAGKAALPMYVASGHGWTSNGMNGVTLQYTFADLTTKVAPALTVQEITRALNQWPKYANVHFSPGLNANAAQTVAIKFAEYDHGDGYPFDGPGGVLAHTFYPVPTNPEPIAGDMHLDGSEDWRVGSDTDIYTVVLHETGHALGLAHTTDTTAIMYPYYSLGKEIGNDDIAGIQALYGPADGSAPSQPAAPSSPAPAAPSISLSIQNPSGANLQTTASSTIVSGIVSNSTGTPAVSWQTDHGQAGVATGTVAWVIPSVPLSLGSNTITVTAVDINTHQTATQSVQITRTAPSPGPAPNPAPPSTPASPSGPDTVPPSIFIQSPASTIVQTSQSTITVSGVASDNIGVASITWQNTLGGNGSASGTTAWTAANIPLFPGTNTLILRAFDAAGNSGWRSLTVKRE